MAVTLYRQVGMVRHAWSALTSVETLQATRIIDGREQAARAVQETIFDIDPRSLRSQLCRARQVPYVPYQLFPKRHHYV